MGDGMGRAVGRAMGRASGVGQTSSTVLFLLLSLRGGGDERQTTKCAVNTSQ